MQASDLSADLPLAGQSIQWRPAPSRSHDGSAGCNRLHRCESPICEAVGGDRRYAGIAQENGQEAPFLDLHVAIKNQMISTKIFDKRDSFNFQIVKFPNLTGNIPLKSSYGVFVV